MRVSATCVSSLASSACYLYMTDWRMCCLIQCSTISQLHAVFLTGNWGALPSVACKCIASNLEVRHLRPAHSAINRSINDIRYVTARDVMKCC